MTFLQELMLSRGHPRQIILHMVGGIWTVYFLWQHQWMWALACFAVSELISETLLLRLVQRCSRRQHWASS